MKKRSNNFFKGISLKSQEKILSFETVVVKKQITYSSFLGKIGEYKSKNVNINLYKNRGTRCVAGSLGNHVLC